MYILGFIDFFFDKLCYFKAVKMYIRLYGVLLLGNVFINLWTYLAKTIQEYIDKKYFVSYYQNPHKHTHHTLIFQFNTQQHS